MNANELSTLDIYRLDPEQKGVLKRDETVKGLAEDAEAEGRESKETSETNTDKIELLQTEVAEQRVVIAEQAVAIAGLTKTNIDYHEILVKLATDVMVLKEKNVEKEKAIAEEASKSVPGSGNFSYDSFLKELSVNSAATVLETDNPLFSDSPKEPETTKQQSPSELAMGTLGLIMANGGGGI